MTHTFIAEHCSDLPVAVCCRVMGVSAIAAAREKIRQCERALEAGGDIATITGWLNQAVAARDAAESVLATTSSTPTMSAADFEAMIRNLPDPAEVFRDGDAADVNELLVGLGVELLYNPIDRTLTASAGPACCATDGVGGPTRTGGTPLKTVLALR